MQIRKSSRAVLMIVLISLMIGIGVSSFIPTGKSASPSQTISTHVNDWTKEGGYTLEDLAPCRTEFEGLGSTAVITRIHWQYYTVGYLPSNFYVRARNMDSPTQEIEYDFAGSLVLDSTGHEANMYWTNSFLVANNLYVEIESKGTPSTAPRLSFDNGNPSPTESLRWYLGSYQALPNADEDFIVEITTEPYRVLSAGTGWSATGTVVGTTDYVDFYKFDYVANARTNVTVTPQTGGKMNFRVYSDSEMESTTLSAISTESGGVDRWDHQATSSCTYYIAVELDDCANGASTTYTININQVADDSYEDNDNFAGAEYPFDTSANRYNLVAFDDDFFAYPFYGGETIYAKLNFTNANGNLDLYLYNGAGTQVASSTSTSSNIESITYTVPGTEQQTFTVRVATNMGTNPAYSLYWNDVAPPIPGDDSYENNDDRASAKILPLGTMITGLRAYDDDYYTNTFLVGDTIYAGLYFSHAQGNLDLYLYKGMYPVMWSSSADDNEFFSYEVTADDIYTLLVSTYYATNEEYAIQWNRNSPVPTSSVTTTSTSSTSTTTTTTGTDDTYEENDVYSAASLVSSGTPLSGLKCYDDDWFKFNVGAGQTISISCTFTHAYGDIDIYLYSDPTATYRDASLSSTDDEQITFLADVTGTWYLKVSPYTINPDYGLLVTISGTTSTTTSTSSTTTSTSSTSTSSTSTTSTSSTSTTSTVVLTDDTYEENDNFNDAKRLTEGSYANLVCWDTDFFYVYLKEGQTLNVQIFFKQNQGNLELRLFEPSHTLAAESQSTDDNESISYTASGAGYYFIQISGSSTSTTNDRYTLVIDLSGGETTSDSFSYDAGKIDGTPFGLIGIVTIFGILIIIRKQRSFT